jgi:predicted metal-dependent enzyme (double-stranded beta helix superfamily)
MTMSLHAPAPPRRKQLDLAELVAVVRAVAEQTELWQPRVRIPQLTQRWWTRLVQSDAVDVWLLSWLPGQSTDLHDHGTSSAAFQVVRGELSEVRIDRTNVSRTVHRRGPGVLTWLAPGVIHDVHGAGNGPAVSIHAYSPPLTTMNYYDVADGKPRIFRTVRSDHPEQELQR